MDAVKKQEKKAKLLPKEIGHAYTPMNIFRWRANPKAGTPLSDVLDAAYWDNVKDSFRVAEPKHQGQVIEVFPEDGEYYAELLAIRLNNGQVAIKKLLYVPLTVDQVKLKREDFIIDFRGNKKWSILRKEDKFLVDELIDSKEAAETKLAQYIEKA